MTNPEKVIDSDYMTNYGLGLVQNGYQIIPIARGKKSPPFDDWQDTRATTNTVRGWIDGEYGRMGIGILTANTPAIDLDIEDEYLANEVEAWITENIGAAPIRYGNGAKRLMLFRTDEPFTKIMTPKYLDDFDLECKIEVLGRGQQFVAFHIHPDTNQPYRWTTEESPINTLVGDLPTLTREQAQNLVDWFNSMAKKWNYRPTGRAGLRSQGSRVIDYDDPFLKDSATVDMSPEQLFDRLMMIKNNDDYEPWYQIGMALYHQFDGGEQGLNMWLEWSESSPKFQHDKTVRKWKSFDNENYNGPPITAATILAMATEAEKEQESLEMQEIIDAYSTARTHDDIEVVNEKSRNAEISNTKRLLIVEALRKAWKRVHDVALGKVEARKQVAYQPRSTGTPDWLKHWAFDVKEGKFYDLTSKYYVSPQSFDLANNKFALSKEDRLEGRVIPSLNASVQANLVHEIPQISGARYEPGYDLIFTLDGNTYANSYDERSVPDMPEWDEMLPRDKKNIERIKRHFAHLLPNEHEARMLIDYLAFIVQNPGVKMSYAVLLQGTEGDGKSFLYRLMTAVMGATNTRVINATLLESKFTEWTIGQCLVCIEEIRMLSKSRYDVYNSLKDPVTNPVLGVNPKGINPYMARNTSNYLMLTNHQDALPLDINNRRYLVLFSQWQSLKELAEFREQEPLYYQELHEALIVSPGALRRFFMDWEMSPEFDPYGNAPLTRARAIMIGETQSDFLAAFHELVAMKDTATSLNPVLFSYEEMKYRMSDLGVNIPPDQVIKTELSRNNFGRVGRVRIENKLMSLWSNSKDNWVDENGHPATGKIREFLIANPNVSDLDEDDEM